MGNKTTKPKSTKTKPTGTETEPLDINNDPEEKTNENCLAFDSRALFSKAHIGGNKGRHIKYAEYISQAQAQQYKIQKLIKIVAISDTHMEHHKLDMPCGDILILSGDYTNNGSIQEAKQVNEWLGKLKKDYKYKHILLINGNHEGFGDIVLTDKYRNIVRKHNKMIRDETTLKQLNAIYNQQIEKLRGIMTNCIILNDEAIVIEKIKFYGTAWTNHTEVNYGLFLEPQEILKKWKNIPLDIDYLITHCPPQGIIDRNDHKGCAQLRLTLNSLKCLKVHQFGHVHAVSNHFFITKQSMIESVKGEKDREICKDGKPWYHLLDKNGIELRKFNKYMDNQMSKEENKLNAMQDFVLFMNAVNNGTEQPMWFYFPVPCNINIASNQ